MVFASGFAGLVYQVLWMAQLGLLFGNTSQAAAATLAAFFAGLGAGSWWWGRGAAGTASPMRLYAKLEFGIAVAALTYFGVLRLFHALYPSLHGVLAGTGWMLVAKFALALLLVFPAAFCMGGTVPAIGQAVIRRADRFGRTGAWLYAVNTLGAASGVACAAFWLIPAIGFAATYLLAMSLSLMVGLLAWRISRANPTPELPQTAEASPPAPPKERFAVGMLCFISGFVILALEVLWTRAFAQVHENSVYSFSIILIVVLVGLAGGAGISSIIARTPVRPWTAIGILVVAGGGLLVISPFLIMHVTQDLRPVDSLEPWGSYVSGLFGDGFRAMGVVVVAMGTVFPFLMKLAEREQAAPGWKLGRLLAINTFGAIAGALLCGFVLLPKWGMWTTMQGLAALYLIAALLLPIGWKPLAIFCRAAAAGLLLLVFTVLSPTALPVTGGSRNHAGEKVLQLWEGSDGTVSVIERESGHRLIKINGAYGLGSTENYLEQAYQARIPLHLFPGTEEIFFLGLGTGISAGAALDERFPNVQRVVSCELIPEVVEAAKSWIPAPLLGGLFEDPRSAVVVEDGRHFLRASDARYDMINSDLFLPYQRGAGSLYSLEHFRVASSRLNPGGVFVQWLPLYQLTEFEFGVIARTMLEVFGEVTMWRNNFHPGMEKVALIGRHQSAPLPVPPSSRKQAMLAAVDGLSWQMSNPDMFRVAPESMPFLYAGNLTRAAELFRDYPLNTDNRPVVEYQTPITFREVARHDKVVWCVGPRLTGWIDRIVAKAPLAEDPVWFGHPDSSRHLIVAGAAFHRAMVARAVGDFSAADREWALFLGEWRAAALSN